MWAAACMLSAAAGAAGMLAWQVRRAGLPPDSCTAAPVSEDSARAELERGRLALAQESAARGAVQKTADSAAAEVARLSAELQFLRGQGKARPPAQTAAPRR